MYNLLCSFCVCRYFCISYSCIHPLFSRVIFACDVSVMAGSVTLYTQCIHTQLTVISDVAKLKPDEQIRLQVDRRHPRPQMRLRQSPTLGQRTRTVLTSQRSGHILSAGGLWGALTSTPDISVSLTHIQGVIWGSVSLTLHIPYQLNNHKAGGCVLRGGGVFVDGGRISLWVQKKQL